VEAEPLRVAIQLPHAAQTHAGAALQLGDRVGSRRVDGCERHHTLRETPLRFREVIVDLGTHRGVGERPSEAHTAIHPTLVHGGEELLHRRDHRVTRMARGEPRVYGPYDIATTAQ